MNEKKPIKGLSLKEKIAQMFILGFQGIEPDKNILTAIDTGIGGVILFAENIKTDKQVVKSVQKLQNQAKFPLFISIDQEGGLVERTIKLENKIDYLTPMALCSSGKEENVKIHTEIMAKELKSLGINMNFAPVLDVNTNERNPIIGVRAFSTKTEEVESFAETVIETLNSNKIIAVGKHFPGHGEAWVDSHLDMPQIDLPFDTLENIHISPFKTMINKGLDAIMVAHVHYNAFNNEKIPASLSKEVITDYLKSKLKFQGLIISDDMVMGGIANHFKAAEACMKAINAGIDIFIFRDSNDKTLDIINQIENYVNQGLIPQSRIEESALKILNYKNEYKIEKNIRPINIDRVEMQEKIDKIACESIKIEKKGTLLPLKNGKKTLLIMPNKEEIYNYSFDKSKLSDFLGNFKLKEINYSLKPSKKDINEIKRISNDYEVIIFASYNPIINEEQTILFNSFDKPKILINLGTAYGLDKFSNVDSVISSFGYRKTNLKAIAKELLGF